MSEFLKMLDEGGFDFIDDAGKPFHVQMWHGNPWLFHKHPDGRWDSLRQLTQYKAWVLSAKSDKGQNHELVLDSDEDDLPC